MGSRARGQGMSSVPGRKRRNSGRDRHQKAHRTGVHLLQREAPRRADAPEGPTKAIWQRESTRKPYPNRSSGGAISDTRSRTSVLLASGRSVISPSTRRTVQA